MQMPSNDENLIHMLFWEFHGTPRFKERGWRRKDPYETLIYLNVIFSRP